MNKRAKGIEKDFFKQWIPLSNCMILLGKGKSTTLRWLKKWKVKERPNPFDSTHKLYWTVDVYALETHLKDRPKIG